MQRRKDRIVAPLVVLLAACSSPPSGTVDGISYKTSLKGSYTHVVGEDGREHAWFASDQSAPSLSLRVQGTPTPVGEAPRCTEHRSSYTWSGPGGFVLGRDGKVHADAPASVGMSLCSKKRPDVTLFCSVFRENGRGELSESEREAFAAVCRGITVQ